MPALFSEVIIPPAVAAELCLGAVRITELEDILQQPWVHVRTLNQPEQVNTLLAKIDLGEAEAICLAIELGVTVILDDMPARKQAAALKVDYTGTLAILAAARRRNLTTPLRPILETLVNDLDFRASPELIIQTLQSVGE
jgi:predicted nucleic acid-binding protein